MLKRNALAAPFELGFQAQKQLEASGSGQGDLMALHYRDEEVIYVQASSDRVTVIFSTMFREETDRVFGKVFLQVRPLSTHLRPSHHLIIGHHSPGICRRPTVTDYPSRPTSPLHDPRGTSRNQASARAPRLRGCRLCHLRSLPPPLCQSGRRKLDDHAHPTLP